MTPSAGGLMVHLPLGGWRVAFITFGTALCTILILHTINTSPHSQAIPIHTPLALWYILST
jgi:hypothetical protein